jgi:hypothetical protein
MQQKKPISISVKLLVCLRSFNITEEVEEFLEAAEKTIIIRVNLKVDSNPG